MLETKNKTINGRSYSCTVFPARVGMKMQARLAAFLGPLLGSLATLAGDKKSDASEALPKGAEKAFEAFAAVKPDEFMQLALDLLQFTKREDSGMIDGKVFDELFSGNYGEMYAVLAFVVDTNYSSLFGAGGFTGLAAKLAVKAGLQSAPSTPST